MIIILLKLLLLPLLVYVAYRMLKTIKHVADKIVFKPTYKNTFMSRIINYSSRTLSAICLLYVAFTGISFLFVVYVSLTLGSISY